MLYGPFFHHLTQLNLAVGSVVNFVYEDGQMRYASDDFAQFVGYAYFGQLLFVEQCRVFVFAYPVENDFLGIGYRHKPHKVIQRLVVVYLLGVRVSYQIALFCRFLFVEDFKFYHPLEV